MKKLKLIIGMIIVIIIILVITILLIKNEGKEEEKSMVTPGIEIEDIQDETSEIERAEYNYINVAMSTYMQNLNLENSRYYGRNENNEYVSIVEEDQKKEYILDLLSQNYISENNITIQNLDEYIETVDEQLIFVPTQLKRLINENVKTYVVSGIIENLNYQLIDEGVFIVNLDFTNRTFSIEPVNMNYDDINSVQQEITSIEENDSNQYNNASVTIENIVKEYMNNYKRLVLAKPNLIYEKLDEEYREKRFGNLEEFEKYINNNRDTIVSLQAQQYLSNSYQDYTEYVCKDEYSNLYVFREYGILNYEILLDSYTIISDNFKETYDSSNEEYKVAMNIDKWIQMLNNRDYTNAYNVLDETFRNNNWGSEEAFEQYMRENFPLHYDVEYTTYSSEGSTYVRQINLTDITGETEGTISLNIIMQLKDNYEFVMSFSLQE